MLRKGIGLNSSPWYASGPKPHIQEVALQSSFCCTHMTNLSVRCCWLQPPDGLPALAQATWSSTCAGAAAVSLQAQGLSQIARTMSQYLGCFLSDLKTATLLKHRIALSGRTVLLGCEFLSL